MIRSAIHPRIAPLPSLSTLRFPRSSHSFTNAVASSSRTRITTAADGRRSISSFPGGLSSCYGKGKGRWDQGPKVNTDILRSGLVQHHLLRNSRPESATAIANCHNAVRHFHATSRREALPLLPAVGALLKVSIVHNKDSQQGGTLLTLATGFSRVLISFFPIGTIATIRFARGVTWLSKDKRVPKASPDAEEFWKMWCEDEKGIRVTHQEAEQLVHAPETPNDGLLAPDGRIAYSVPLPKHWRQRHDQAKPEDEDDRTAYARWVRHTTRRIHNTFYFLPELPPASVRYYNELPVSEREEVDALRRYWTSLKMFKDRLKTSRWIVASLILVPIALLLGVWATGLERVPFTGRWRLILLTAEEEDTISKSLEGANWFTSVINLLTSPESPAPPIVPLSDWRWQWVQGTLRHLEACTLAAAENIEAGIHEHPSGASDLCPPSSKYPLRPRPRASARLHAALPGGVPDSGSEHLELGPPYNIMIMESPDKNAFSYGFGGKGAGGIVIFTGLLDEILSKGGQPPARTPAPSRGLFGGLLSSAPPPAPPPKPTEEQTLHLATVLAHEMGHLLLSHHLETLSHQQVLWPSMMGMGVDLLRAFIWPFTLVLYMFAS